MNTLVSRFILWRKERVVFINTVHSLSWKAIFLGRLRLRWTYLNQLVFDSCPWSETRKSRFSSHDWTCDVFFDQTKDSTLDETYKNAMIDKRRLYDATIIIIIRVEFLDQVYLPAFTRSQVITSVLITVELSLVFSLILGFFFHIGLKWQSLPHWWSELSYGEGW